LKFLSVPTLVLFNRFCIGEFLNFAPVGNSYFAAGIAITRTRLLLLLFQRLCIEHGINLASYSVSLEYIEKKGVREADGGADSGALDLNIN
jgi:hypothetical protein